MDEDDYNALDMADIYGEEEPLHYARMEDEDTAHEHLVNKLDNAMRRVPKRPLTVENCDALDWHMRVPCTFEEIEGKRRKKEQDEAIINRLTQRILQARRRHHLAKEGTSSLIEKQDEGNQKSVMLFPPIDGTPWITISSPDCGRRYYVRLKKLLTKQPSTDISEKENLFNLATSSVVSKARALANLKLDENLLSESLFSDGSDLKSGQDQLWVDKYAPRTYAELISDDRVNRLLMNWMKLWDECVFKRPVCLPDSVTSEEEMLGLDNGKPRRPKHNDDRNVADFERRIEEAVRTVRTLDADSRPLCLLLDEIDGAPVESIRLLVKVVNKTGRGFIRRPIICACNNLYTPSLRELRPIALVLQVPTPDPDRLTKRIKQIAQLEDVRIDTAAVSALVSNCGLDLRSCLNGLQFLAARYSSAVITADVVSKYGDGERQYTERTLFDAWSCVLELRHHCDKRGKIESLVNRAERVGIVAQRCAGDSSRFFSGLFANYLNAVSGSSSIPAVQRTVERFCDYDLLTSFVNRTANYTLLKYSTVISVMVHFFVSSSSRVQLAYPTSEQNVSQKRKQNIEALECLRANPSLSVCSDKMLVLDCLPLLVIIIQPPLKQVNAQLYSERELLLFRSIVATMSFYSLTFKPIFQDGTTVFSFYPAVDVIALFPVEEDEEYSRQMVPLSKSARQLIAHQIELAGLKSVGNVEEQRNPVELPRTTAQAAQKAEAYSSVFREKRECRGLIFRYNHGFSNAIRRNVRMRNLIFDS